MSGVFDLKTVFMTPLIKLMIGHPKLMESRMFLKAMLVFPEKISRTYDSKLNSSDISYQAALTEGLNLVENDPKKILDLCTGTGFAAFSAIQHFPEAHVTGLDQSHGMIELARSKTDSADAGRIRFDMGNAMKLPYENERFDLVMTSNAPVYLDEAARVLKSGGIILVAFSFGKGAFKNAEKDLSALMNKSGIELLRLGRYGDGVAIIGRKKLS